MLIDAVPTPANRTNAPPAPAHPPSSAANARRFARLHLSAAIGLALLVLIPSPARAQSDLDQSERRVIALPGRTLVVPLARSSGSGTTPALPTVRLGDRTVPAELVYLAAGPVIGHAWLPPRPAWSVRSRSDNLPGLWAVVFDIPPAGPSGLPIRFNQRPLTVTWSDPPPARTDHARLPRLALPGEARTALNEAIRFEALDPYRRWRAALVAERFGIDDLPWPDEPVLRALAAQNEDRWRLALATLARDDAELAAGVLARATAVVSLPDAVTVLPAWSLDDSGLTQMREVLLDPASTPAQRTARASEWLASDAAALAWVVDDAGRIPGLTARRFIEAGVVNFTHTPTVASLALEGDSARNPVRLEPHASALLRVLMDTDAAAPDGVGTAVIARSAAWSRPLPILRAPLGAAPPGLVIGPMRQQWDLASWRSGLPRNPRAEEAAAAILSREAGLGGWALYIECRFPPGTAPTGDVVRIRTGARGSEVAAVVEVGPGVHSSPRVRLASDRWTAVVPLPIEPGAREAFLAIDRTDAAGQRSSWPRAIMPSQREPGRAVIDLSAWGGLGTGDP